MTNNTEKTFTVVGTSVNKQGELKIRWANDKVQRINILIRSGGEDIDLHEIPTPMNKLDAAKWLLANVKLTPDQDFVVQEKVDQKEKQLKRAKTKEVIQENIKTNVKENKATDPRVAEFINKTLEETEA